MSFDTTEKYQSQIPALQLLVALGFTPLSQAEALALRGGRLRNVVLDEVLTEQLLRLFPHRPRPLGAAGLLALVAEAARHPPDAFHPLSLSSPHRSRSDSGPGAGRRAGPDKVGPARRQV